MKINKTNILLVLIACLAAYTIFQNQGIKTDVAEYNSKIESIQKDIDSVYIANDKIDDQIEKWQHSLSLSVGFNTWNLRFSYGLTPFLSSAVQTQEGIRPNIYPVQVGLIFYLL